MRTLTLLSAVLVLLALGACTVRIKPPIEIEVDGGGKNCPPGQAKKGRC
ncbi:MAG: hypothetical protein ACYC7L_00305 [Nitrospirota bacterium]